MTFVYQDHFVTLTELAIEINNYYIPSRKSRRVLLDSVTVLYFEDQSQSKMSYTRVWGKGLGKISWALDIKRAFGKVNPVKGRANIVLDLGGELRIGFTVMNVDKFMEKMRDLLDYHVIIVDNINL